MSSSQIAVSPTKLLALGVAFVGAGVLLRALWLWVWPPEIEVRVTRPVAVVDLVAWIEEVGSAFADPLRLEPVLGREPRLAAATEAASRGEPVSLVFFDDPYPTLAEMIPGDEVKVDFTAAGPLACFVKSGMPVPVSWERELADPEAQIQGPATLWACARQHFGPPHLGPPPWTLELTWASVERSLFAAGGSDRARTMVRVALERNKRVLYGVTVVNQQRFVVQEASLGLLGAAVPSCDLVRARPRAGPLDWHLEPLPPKSRVHYLLDCAAHPIDARSLEAKAPTLPQVLAETLGGRPLLAALFGVVAWVLFVFAARGRTRPWRFATRMGGAAVILLAMAALLGGL